MSSHTHKQSIDFEKLIDEYYVSLYRFAYSLSGKEADAWDLTQQTFSRWAEKGHTLRDTSKVKSWLFTTLYREYLKWSKRNRKVYSIETTTETTEAETVPPEVVDQADASALMDHLAEIEEIYRVPLSLFYLEDLTYREIAEMLDIPTGTVMSRLSRGKEQLRRRLTSDAATRNVKTSSSNLSRNERSNTGN
jgi:RNA polymerase sigma-70 factor, ECF subfamily